MKKFFFLTTVLVILGLFLAPQTTFAQGTCQAQKDLATGGCSLATNNCDNHYLPFVWQHGPNDACDCRCDPDPSNPLPSPSSAGCAACPGGLCENQSCCSPCIPETNNITGICHCALPTQTAPPGNSTTTGAVGCIPTAIGCIDVSGPSVFVNTILNLAIGLAGGIAILLIIFGGFQILASSGNPEKVSAGKEMITSAIAGLLLIVFAIFILRIIGVEILKIPGFN